MKECHALKDSNRILQKSNFHTEFRIILAKDCIEIYVNTIFILLWQSKVYSLRNTLEETWTFKAPLWKQWLLNICPITSYRWFGLSGYTEWQAGVQFCHKSTLGQYTLLTDILEKGEENRWKIHQKEQVSIAQSWTQKINLDKPEVKHLEKTYNTGNLCCSILTPTRPNISGS